MPGDAFGVPDGDIRDRFVLAVGNGTEVYDEINGFGGKRVGKMRWIERLFFNSSLDQSNGSLNLSHCDQVM